MIKVVRHCPDRYGRAYRERGAGPYEVEMKDAGLKPVWHVTEYYPANGDYVKIRYMSASGTPYQVATTRLSKVAAANAAANADHPGGLLSHLNPAEKPLLMSETIRCRNADIDEMKFFESGLPLPVFEIRHVTYTSEGQHLETTMCILPCDRWELEYTWEGK
jgi:DNA-binding GntR family transcriptional regulator